MADIEGIKILGDRDPMSDVVESDPKAERSQRLLPGRCRRLADRLEEVLPTVLLVHRQEVGECGVEQAERLKHPLVYVWGHLHEQSYEETSLLVSLSPGTSGANGIKTPREAPYGFSLLEFDPDRLRLASSCHFQFDGPGDMKEARCYLNPMYEGVGE